MVNNILNALSNASFVSLNGYMFRVVCVMHEDGVCIIADEETGEEHELLPEGFDPTSDKIYHLEETTIEGA